MPIDIEAIIGISMSGVLIFTGLVLHHFRKIAEMKLRLTKETDQEAVSELREIKQQLAELRDTTTRYDISFDAALQRLESRIAHVEQKALTAERESAEERISIRPG